MNFVTNRRSVLLAGAGALALTACGRSEQTANAPGAAAGEMVLTRGNGAEPETLDPHLIGGDWESSIEGDLILGLTTEGPRGEAVAGAAERWETSENGLTWTFHLRDHTWSDGHPVTAEDFVYAWRRLLDPKLASTSAYFLHIVKNGKAVNAGKMPATALGASPRIGVPMAMPGASKRLAFNEPFRKFIGGEPMKPATKRLSGSL